MTTRPPIGKFKALRIARLIAAVLCVICGSVWYSAIRTKPDGRQMVEWLPIAEWGFGRQPIYLIADGPRFSKRSVVGSTTKYGVIEVTRYDRYWMGE